VAEAFHQPLVIERDECLVLDDQNVGGGLVGEFTTGLLHQLAQGLNVDIQHLGGVVFRKAFQRDQQKCLPWHGRDLRKMTFDRLVHIAARRFSVQRDRIPDLREELIQSDPGRGAGI